MPQRIPRIVVADDDNEMRYLLSRALRKQGYDVVECCDGWNLSVQANAAFVLKEVDIDLIISDIRMPKVSGLELLKQWQEKGDHPPVILITAFGDEETHQAAEKYGAVTFFDKPFDIDDLVADVLKRVPIGKPDSLISTFS